MTQSPLTPASQDSCHTLTHQACWAAVRGTLPTQERWEKYYYVSMRQELWDCSSHQVMVLRNNFKQYNENYFLLLGAYIWPGTILKGTVLHWTTNHVEQNRGVLCHGLLSSNWLLRLQSLQLLLESLSPVSLFHLLFLLGSLPFTFFCPEKYTDSSSLKLFTWEKKQLCSSVCISFCWYLYHTLDSESWRERLK